MGRRMSAPPDRRGARAYSAPPSMATKNDDSADGLARQPTLAAPASLRGRGERMRRILGPASMDRRRLSRASEALAVHHEIGRECSGTHVRAQFADPGGDAVAEAGHAASPGRLDGSSERTAAARAAVDGSG